MNELTIHMIGNAHLDPVWLWHWQRGSDEALATCRAACDLLDDYPEVVFTRGEAWVHEQVRHLDSNLFKRVKKHVRGGRWSVANGWWVQPDLNLPTEEALRKNIELGHKWFKEHLELDSIPVAYNVDSFGHEAYLPRLLRENGQKYYVMMRPEPHEMKLPSDLFKWRSPDGSEVLVWRVFQAYLKHNVRFMHEGIQALVKEYQGKLGNVMCFYGVGDHGGGPTRRQVEWIQQNKEYAPGVRLEFSSPEKFFTTLDKSDIKKAPVVSDELQMHAIGCYSVCGDLKRLIRKAEIRCAEVENLRRHLKTDNQSIYEKKEKAWERICFNQFHDILPGSAVRSVLKTAEHQVGEALSLVNDATLSLLRKHAGLREKCLLDGHRVNVMNRLSGNWSGMITGEIWTDWQPWEHHLEDENGNIVPTQLVNPESLVMEASPMAIPKLIFPLTLKSFEHKAFRIVEGVAETPRELSHSRPRFENGELLNNKIRVRFSQAGIAATTRINDGTEVIKAPISWECLRDDSDTWGHGLDKFDSPPIHSAVFSPNPTILEEGVFATTVRLDGVLHNTPISLFATLLNDDSTLRLEFLLNYNEPMSLLKAVIRPSGGSQTISHLVAGGWIERRLDGLEKPFHHAVLTRNSTTKSVGVIAPDTFSIDATTDAIRPTIVRNNLYALHKSQGATDLVESSFFKGKIGTDEGPLLVRLALACDAETTETNLRTILNQYFSPPHFWDDYRDGQRLSNTKE